MEDSEAEDSEAEDSEAEDSEVENNKDDGCASEVFFNLIYILIY